MECLTRNIKKISLVLFCVWSAGANASTTTWEWELTPGRGDCTSNCSSISIDDTEDGQTITADISGYSDTTGSSDLALESGNLHYYSGGGWGLVNQDENGAGSQHTFDNVGSYLNGGGGQITNPDANDYDMALVSFDTSVELKAIDFGYINTDGDFSVLAFDMTADYASNNRSTWSDVADSTDWIKVGNYDADNTGYYSINNSNTSSRYWLIGAYNSAFSEALENVGQLFDGNDQFKIRKLKAESTTDAEEVSSPATLGLMLLGAFGVIARRKNKPTT